MHDRVELSGGKWQKFAIAKGIFRDCELIAMDEPTSAIDHISETGILKSFLEIARNKTAIIVSHRTGLCTMVGQNCCDEERKNNLVWNS